MFFARCGKAIEVSSISFCGQFNIEKENIHREEAHQQRASVLVIISTEINKLKFLE